MNLKKEFLQTTVKSSYESTITVDGAVFGFQDGELKLLLVKRALEPFKGSWMLPGGVMDEGQSLEEAINNVLFKLTGINDIHKEQVRCYSDVDRHPVKRVVTVSFYALIKPENHPVIPKNYVSEVKWFALDEIPQKLGFDHSIIWRDALELLKRNMQEKLLFGELLPAKFTLKELQDLYESILGETLDKRNFRKKITQLGLVKGTGKKKPGVKGGPELFKLKKKR
ncbi:NUDIX hydrolase [Marinigracilibium pacificum]|uniref:NUDIX hydrolase n=1 Tax=Marinigracilibium pacificum TaxID=2729599 RepID=A0A848IWC1_9BACT|nr:NUDIX domain-containing protein [Marinigracilibium pacificum]NMM47575.1 NUDIX hydrolase [Marinigracilibium pacificum]